MDIVTPFMFLVLGLINSADAFLSHHELCEEIMYVDCTREAKASDRLYRDNNGIIYENFCLYSQAKCRDASLDIDAVCTCQHPSFGTNTGSQSTSAPTVPTAKPMTPDFNLLGTTPTTTKQTTTPTTTTMAPQPTTDAVISVFCKNKDSVTCPNVNQPLCASDNQTYPNRCQFAKAQCDSPNLSLVREGAC